MGRRGLILILLIVVVIVIAVLAVMALPSLLPGGNGTTGPAAEPTVTPTPAPTAEPMVPIVIAVQNLQRGDLVVTGTYGFADWPQSRVLPGFITDTAQLEGKLVRLAVFQGEPILSTMLLDDLSNEAFGSDIAAQIPSGRVAISIPYDKYHGVASGIRAGDHINVIVTWAIVDIDQSFQTILPNISAIVAPPNPDGTLQGLVPSDISWVQVDRIANSSVNPAFPAYFGRGEDGVNIANDFYVVPAEPQRSRYVTQNILQDLIVLHLGDFKEDLPFIPEPTEAPAQPGPDGSTPTPVPTTAPEPTATIAPPSTITLLASPQDALVLEFINRQMERYPASVLMTLVLRSTKDNNVPQAATDSVTLQYMFETYNIALPAKLNYGPNNPQNVITSTVATRNVTP